MVDEPDRMALDHYLAKNGLGYYTTIFMSESVHEGVYLYSGKCQRLDDSTEGTALFSMDMGMKRRLPEECFAFTPLYIYLEQNNIISADLPRFYVITMFPEKFREIISMHYPELRLEQLSRGLSYTNIFRVTGGVQGDETSP